MKTKTTVTFRCRWWVKWYVLVLWYFCDLTGMKPDVDKLAKVIERGMYADKGDT